MGLRWLVATAVIFGAAVSNSNPVFADIADDELQIGLSGYVKVGLSAPVQVVTKDADVKSVIFEAIDPHGNMVRYPLVESKSKLATDGRLFRGRFQAGRLNGTFRLVYEMADGTTKVRRVVAGKEEVDLLKRPLRQSVLLVMTLGKPRGFADLASFGQGKEEKSKTSENLKTAVQLVELANPSQFPTDFRDLAAVNVIVHAGSYHLDPERDRALRRWVAEGGHLVISRGTDLNVFLREGQRRVAARKGESKIPAKKPEDRKPRDNFDSLLATWLPVTIVGQLQLPDLTELETYAGRNSPIIFNARVPAAQILDPKDEPQGAGLTPVVIRPGPLVARVPYGMGIITFCAIDLDKPPLSSWADVDSLGKRLLEGSLTEFQLQRQGGQGRISQSGVTDLGTQLHAIQEDFPAVERMSALKSIGLLLFYIALIGPIDYLLVHRLLKRPRLTWVTFPALVIGATVLSVYNADELNGSSLQLNAVQIVDIDATIGGETGEPADQQIRNTVWTTLYSPVSRRYDLKLQPLPMTPEDVATNGKPNVEATSLSWSGVNETVFGGMHRTGGLDIGRLTYTIPPESLAAKNVPIHLWSTKSLSASWRSSAKRIVESQLAINDIGRLSGTLTHHLPVEIDDWIIVHGNQLYRSKNDGAFSTIRPHETFSPEKDVLAAGFLSVMTKIRLQTKQGFEKKAIESPEASEQTAYDTTDKDLYRFVHVMSFHQAIGGRKYTGLDDFSLRNHDFSRLLPLNRAVLIGRIRQPLATLHHLPSGDDPEQEPTALEPTRADTFVRIVLPVRKRRSFLD